MGYLKTINEASESLRVQEPFTTGTLSATVEAYGEDYAYVVRSYGVVIARSNVNLGWSNVYADSYNYSKTTSKHANIVKKAWGI